jgi:adenylate cyclase
MGATADPAEAARRELFRATMAGGEVDQLRMRRMFARLPRDPRCKSCNAPFGAPGSLVSRMMGRQRWAKNPRFCNRCYTFLVEYGLSGVEVEVTALFADVRSSTRLAEQIGPAAFRGRINQFYRIASDALIRTDGLVDKFIGDGVVGLYIPGLSGPAHATRAVEAARLILARVSAGEEALGVGVGVHTGEAFVGAVGDRTEVQDFTALGDAVNATARLSSVAEAGEALVSVRAATAAGLDLAGLERRHLTLKGRSEPIDVVVIRPSS